MKNIFNFIGLAYRLWSNNQLERHYVKSVRCGPETTSHINPKTWNLLPIEYQEIDSLSIIKRKILNW